MQIEELGEAERLAVLYAPQTLRTRYHAFLALDAQLARIALTAREPALAQLKLAWWRDAVGDLARAQRTPLLRDLKATWAGQSGALGGLVDAWEDVAAGEGPFSERADRLGDARAACFAAIAGLPVDARCRTAARRWTIVTVAGMAPGGEGAAMLTAATTLPVVRLPAKLRPLTLLDGLARRSVSRGGGALVGDRLSPLAALRLGIFGR